jgi:hypothetical protein
MKKLALITTLALLTLPAFTQEKDSRAPFQGSWYGAIDDEFIFFIFMNDVFTLIRQDSEMIGFISGKYSVFEKKLYLEPNKCMVGKNGSYLPYEEGVQNIQYQYIISKGELVLVDNHDGNIVTYLKNIE